MYTLGLANAVFSVAFLVVITLQGQVLAQVCGSCNGCADWFKGDVGTGSALGCCKGPNSFCQGLPCCNTQDNNNYTANNCLAFPVCQIRGDACCTDKKQQCCSDSSDQSSCCQAQSPFYAWKTDGPESLVSVNDGTVVFSVKKIDMTLLFPPSGLVTQIVLEIPTGWELSERSKCSALIWTATAEVQGPFELACARSNIQTSFTRAIMFSKLSTIFASAGLSERIDFQITNVHTPKKAVATGFKQFWAFNETSVALSQFVVNPVVQGKAVAGYFSTSHLYINQATAAHFELSLSGALNDSVLMVDLGAANFTVYSNSSWSLDVPGVHYNVSLKSQCVSNQCNITIPVNIPDKYAFFVRVDQIMNPPGRSNSAYVTVSAMKDGQVVYVPSPVKVNAILTAQDIHKYASPFSTVSIVIYCAGVAFCLLLIFSNRRQKGKPIDMTRVFEEITATAAVLNFLVLICANVLWLADPSIVYSRMTAVSVCLVWTMLLAVVFNLSTMLMAGVRQTSAKEVGAFFALLVLAFYGVVIWLVAASSVPEHELLERQITCSTDTCGISGTDDTLAAYADVQPAEWGKIESDTKVLFWKTLVTSMAFCLANLLILGLGCWAMRIGKHMLDEATGLDHYKLRQALKMIQIAFGIVTLVYLVAWILHVALVSSFVNYQWWYVFAIWLPNAVPPCCFVALQWASGMETLKAFAANVNNQSPIHSLNDESALGGRYSEVGTPSLSGQNGSNPGWGTNDSLYEITESFSDNQSTRARGLTGGTDSGSTGNGAVHSLKFMIKCVLGLPRPPPKGCYLMCSIQDIEIPGPPTTRKISLGGDLMASIKGTSPSQVPDASPTALNTSWTHIGSTETVHSWEEDQNRFMINFHALIEVVRSNLTEFNICFTAYHGESGGTTPSIESGETINLLESNDDDERESDDFPTPALLEQRYICEFHTTSSELVAASKAEEGLVIIANDYADDMSATNNREAPCLLAQPIVAPGPRVELGNTNVHKVFSYTSVDSREFIFVEDLTESVFANHVPRQILDILIPIRTREYYQARQELMIFDDYVKQQLNKDNHGGIYATLIDHIQDHDETAVVRRWLEDRVEQRKKYVKTLRSCRKSIVQRELKGEVFKKSTLKKDADLRFVPINLQVQEMWVGPRAAYTDDPDSSETGLYDTITVGAMAAHVYKYKNGGLSRLKAQLRKMKPKPRNKYSHEWTDEDQRIHDLKWEITTRMDMCFTHVVSALTASFTRKVDLALQATRPARGEFLLTQWATLGYLFQIESLLSTHGKEIGMIEDMTGALSELRNVQFVITEVSSTAEDIQASGGNPLISDANSTDPGVVSVDVFADYATYLKETGKPGFNTTKGTEKSYSSSSAWDDGTYKYCSGYLIRLSVRCGNVPLPKNIQRGAPISVFPVIFTQGVNEMQTIANSTNSSQTELQDVINSANLKFLTDYANNFFGWIAKEPRISKKYAGHRHFLDELAVAVTTTRNKKIKAVEILQNASDFCREINGGRVTVCKSAKDRTSMSVTLEQGRILVRHHLLAPELLAHTVASMRSTGVRLENAYKNTGRRFYAFNALQRKMLPEEYRCPVETGGQNVS